MYKAFDKSERFPSKYFPK